MISLTRTAHGPASGLRQGRSRACDAYQRRIAAACPFIMTTESSHSRGTAGPSRHPDAPPASLSRIRRAADVPPASLSRRPCVPPASLQLLCVVRLHNRFVGQKLVSQATYWRRRVVVLAACIAVLTLLTWAVNLALSGSQA